MARCNVSDLVLLVNVGPYADDLSLNGSDLDNQNEAKATLDLLVERGCEMEVVLERGSHEENSDPHAVYSAKDGEIRFYNFLINTGEVADRLGVEPKHIVRCIDSGVLSGVKTMNDAYHLVVKDTRHDTITSKEALAAKGKIVKKKRVKGRGLRDLLIKIISQNGLPRIFGVDEIKKALYGQGWVLGRNYADTSIPSALRNLEADGVVRLSKDGMVKDRRWTLTSSVNSAPSVAASVAPAPHTVGGKIQGIVEELSDFIVDRAKERAMEKLGL